jgi:hypothetical protein
MQLHLSVNRPLAMVEQQGVCAPARPGRKQHGWRKDAPHSYFAWGCFRYFVF